MSMEMVQDYLKSLLSEVWKRKWELVLVVNTISLVIAIIDFLYTIKKK